MCGGRHFDVISLGVCGILPTKNDASTDGVEADIYGGNDDEDDDDNGYVDDIMLKSMKAFGLPLAIIVGC